jgi:hypothetical protein
MNRNHDPILQSRSNMPAVFYAGLLAITLLGVAAAADTMPAGIEAVAVHACPDPCSCMPASQAEQMGYIVCSVNQTPCFNDSVGRPLYCYRPSSAECQPGSTCGDPAGAGAAVTGGNAGPGAMTANPDGTGDGTACPSGQNGNCPAPVTSAAAAGSQPGDIFSMIAGFFRSLFGMK